MKAYGVKKKDSGCCPGHNKFSDHSYNNRRSIKAKSRDTKYAHGRERTLVRVSTQKTVSELDIVDQNDQDNSDKVPHTQFCYDYCCTVRDFKSDFEEIVAKYVLN